MALVDSTGETTVDSAPTAQARRGRRRFAALTIFAAFAVIAALVFLAVSADGREVSRASSNDGGAWLVNREFAVVGHKNRSAGEISASIRVTNSPTADIYQAQGVVVVHDIATGHLLEVDERAFAEDQQPTQLPEFTSVVAIDNAVLIVRNDPLSVWHVDAAALRSLATLDGTPPITSASGSGLVAATPQGSIVVLDASAGSLQWYRNGVALDAPVAIDGLEDAIDITIVDQTAVILFGSGDLVVAGRTGVDHTIVWAESAAGQDRLARLQQPADGEQRNGSRSATAVVGSTANGQVLEVTFGDLPAVTTRVTLAGSQPLAPIAHGGCIHAVTTNPPVYGVTCGDAFNSRPLAGASQELRLRLVNGSVWVNDLEDGGVWVTNDDLEVERIDDWSLATETETNGDDADDDGGGDDSTSRDELVIEDPDAIGEVQSSDDFDLTEANVAPVAVDDEARTRVDRTTVVDVLANDSDANNDILVVTVAELINGDARVVVTPSGEQVQVTPAAGFVGLIELSYSISDGESDPVSAMVRVQVLPDDSQNTAPTTVTDVVATAPGHSTTIDLLFNDSDAEGDGLALISVTTETGTLRWDPSGQVTFTPDSNTEAGWIELPYVVRDDRGAEAQGLLRVEIRDSGANQEPDARNDHASTVVGRTVVLQLLANDSDPDGDTLIVGSRPVLLEPAGADVRVSVTPDGEFVFVADEAGTYLFSYTVTDSAVGGSESDTARIRIDVADSPLNEPPIAVRDDIVIPVGSTRAVYALANDGDPSGDVVAIIDWQSAPGLVIVEITEGSGVVGFLITALPGAPSYASFNYWISDGVNDPVAAPIVVAIVDEVPTDQPPFAVDDVVEARAGSTIKRLPVLANDFDPEGGALRVVSVGTTELANVVVSPDRQALTIEIPESAVSSFSVPYDIEDQAGNRAAAIARVQLLSADAPNRAPTARTDQARMQRETTARIDVLANDSDPDADLISLEGIVEQPANGTARPSADGIVTYQPDAGFTGTDHIRYAIVDSSGDRDVGDIFVGVMKPPEANRDPIANDDAYELFGIPTISPLDVLANDSDPDGDPIRVVAHSQPAIGSVELDALGRVVYTPPQRLDQAAAAVFTYQITDNAGNRDSATVTVSMEPFEAEQEEELPERDELIEPDVTPEPEFVPEPTPEPTPESELENESPVAINDDRGPVAVGTQVNVEVLENDFDPDGPHSELVIVDVGPGAELEGDTVVVVAGEQEFTVSYTIADAFGATAVGQVRVFVIDNQAPIVEPLKIATEYETAVTLDLADQASDSDNDELFFACCDNIRGGSIRNITSDADVLTLTFVPDDRFIGGAGFSYSVDDQNGHQTAGSVSIDVRPPGNQAPRVIDDSISIPQDTFRQIELTDLATDPDDDDLTFEIVEQPGAGIAAQIEGSVAVIDVGADVAVQSGLVLVYEAFDGLLRTQGRIEIEVTPVGNEPPVASDVDIEIPAGASNVVNLALATTDADAGDPTTWSVDEASFGPLDVVLSGSSLQIRAPADAADEVAAIAYTATDSRGGSATAFVNVVVVAPTAPVPIANDDAASTRAGEPVVIDVLANDFDPLDQGLVIVVATTNDGTATIVDDRIRFAPADGLTGEAVITYTINDAAARPATAIATVVVTAAPDRPAPPDVTGGNGTVLIEWTTPSPNGAGIDGYRLTRFSGTTSCPVSATVLLVGNECFTLITPLPGGACPPSTTPDPSGNCRRPVALVSSGGLPQTISLPVQNSYSWGDLENGETYSFSVTAFNAVGDSVPSEPSARVIPNLIPEVPAPPQVTFGNELITVTWEPPTDNGGSRVDRYQLEIGGAESDVIDIGDTTTHVWRELENGEEYNFRVSAGNDAGFSNFSASSPTEHPETTPGSPTIQSVERGITSGSLVISWARPTQDGGGTVDNYRVIPSIGQPVETGDDLTNYTWLDLENGVPITFEVQAHNRAGWSTQLSAPSAQATPCGAPDPVTWVSAVRLDGGAQLVFDEPELNGCGLTGYVITSTDMSTLETQVKNTQLTSFPFGDLINGENYSFHIRATNTFGTGPSSKSPVEVTPAGPPICPETPNVTAVPTDVGEIRVSWDNAIANGRMIDTYQIDRGTGFVDNLGGAQPAENVRGLTNGSTHTFAVRAVNEVGTSPTCGSATATAWDIPNAFLATLNYDTLTQVLSWTLSGGDSVATPITEWEVEVWGEEIVCVDIGNGQQACQSPTVHFGPISHSGTSGPIPATVEDVISEAGRYWASTRVCNVVGCWASMVEGTGIFGGDQLDPPGPPDKIDSSTGGVYLSGAACRCPEYTGSTETLVVTETAMPNDNGSPITDFDWELRRYFQPVSPTALDVETSGSAPRDVFPWFQTAVQQDFYSTQHPGGPTGGWGYWYQARVRAVNALGEADWSEWFDHFIGAPSPYIEIQSSSQMSGCSIGDECHEFTGYVLNFPQSVTYPIFLTNIESGGSLVRDCIGTVTTDSIGKGFYSVVCDTGEDPSLIRLSVDGYLSIQNGSSGQEPDLWYPIP